MNIVIPREDITTSMIGGFNTLQNLKENKVLYKKGVQYKCTGSVVYFSLTSEVGSRTGKIFSTKDFTKFFIELDKHRDNIIDEILNDNSKTN